MAPFPLGEGRPMEEERWQGQERTSETRKSTGYGPLVHRQGSRPAKRGLRVATR